MRAPPRRRVSILVRGVVQGVGFRPFVWRIATRDRLCGFIRNRAGEVKIEVEGTRDQITSFLLTLRTGPPPLARVLDTTVRDLPVTGEKRGFTIAPSCDEGDERRPGGAEGDTDADPDSSGTGWQVAADAATCPACRRELFDPSDRRYRYPFLNCTDCGPRFTIIEALPYDRPRTSMARFPLCVRCRNEYQNVRDRRFHAQPVACPVCGPTLTFVVTSAAAAEAPRRSKTALAEAARLLRGGSILALKGLGGYQLACDATWAGPALELRRRKRRPQKPFAVMVENLDAARKIAVVSDAEAAALASPGAPIVLLERRAEAAVARSIAPDLSTLGVLLPTTPLHHLLARELRRPLVMTSGNASDEPIAIEDADALSRLGGVADAFLVHDRPILARYDDSVVRVLGERVVPIRRARGLAPVPLRARRRATAQILAFGAEQKSAFCFLRGEDAYLGQHLGDLKSQPTLDAFREALQRHERLFALAPAVLACDLHPDYLSTREAERWERERGLPRVACQHHHAHLVSCLADHGRADAPAIGLVFDGTGLGPDGTVWGGEVLVGSAEGFERVGHLRAAPLPGGEAAVRAPWRTALSALRTWLPDFPELASELVGRPDPTEVGVVEHQIETGLASPLHTSMGRLFDAVSCLLGVGAEATYEGELACRLEGWAVGAEAARASVQPLPLPVTGAGTAADPAIANPGPLLQAMLERLAAGEPPQALALGFHRAVAAASAETARLAASAAGLDTVALSGGCFQSRLLTRLTIAALQARGLTPLTHREAPPNDGGLALGQAWIAEATSLRV